MADPARQRASWALMEVVRRGATALSFVFIARGLSVEEFAAFVTIAAAFGIVSSGFQSSIDRVLVRAWVSRTRDADSLWSLSVLGTIAASLAGVGAVAAAGGGRALLVAVTGFGISVIGQTVLWGGETRARAREDLTASSRLKTSGEVIPALLRSVGAASAGTLEAVGVGSAIAGLVLIAMSLALPHPRLKLVRAEDVRRVSRTMGTASGIGLATAVYWRLDIFLLMLLTNAGVVAGYAIAVRVIEVVLVVPSVYGQLSISALVRGGAAAEAARRRGARMVRVGVAIAIGLVALSIPLVAVLEAVADQTTRAAYLVALSPTIPAAFLGAVLGNVLFARHEEHVLLRTVLAMIAINVALNLALIPVLGGVGAAIVTSLTEVAGVAFLALHARRRPTAPVSTDAARAGGVAP